LTERTVDILSLLVAPQGSQVWKVNSWGTVGNVTDLMLFLS